MGCAVSRKLKMKKKESSSPPPPDKLRSTVSSLIVVPVTLSESSEPSQQQTAIEDVTKKEEEVEPVMMGTVLLEPERKWCLDKLDEWRMELDQGPSMPLEWPTVRFIKPVITVDRAGGDQLSPLPRVVKEKDAHFNWMKKDKERRKSIYVKRPSDDTVYALPTRMPDISFTDYYDIPF